MHLSKRQSFPSLWLGVIFLLSLAPNNAQAAKVRAVELQAFPGILRADGSWMIKGRVLRKSRWIRAGAKPSRLRNIMGMVRRFTRKSASQVRISLSLGAFRMETEADSKGYFHFEGKLPTSRPTSLTSSQPSGPQGCKKPFWKATKAPYTSSPGIYPFTITLPPQTYKGKPYQAEPFQGFLVHRSANKGLHLITDLDDTLIWTHVTQKTKLIKQALFKDVTTVKTIEGALPFLRNFLCHPRGFGGGTLHYLSGSPTRLFDRVVRIFQLHTFPLGSLTLRPLSSKSLSQGKQSLYKVVEIHRILRTYPTENFVLLGDNGEKDPIIYNIIRNAYPKRIRAILIHQVKPLTLEQQALANTFFFKRYQDAAQYIEQIAKQGKLD